MTKSNSKTNKWHIKWFARYGTEIKTMIFDGPFNNPYYAARTYVKNTELRNESYNIGYGHTVARVSIRSDDSLDWVDVIVCGYASPNYYTESE